jgi:hypothetical protein
MDLGKGGVKGKEILKGEDNSLITAHTMPRSKAALTVLMVHLHFCWIGEGIGDRGSKKRVGTAQGLRADWEFW